MKHYNRVLTIAGSDSGGGAGIQADIKTISACGCYATSAITAVTVQNTLGVSDVCPVPVDVISAQIDAVLSDIGADAIKIGMLHSSETIEAIAAILGRYSVCHIVLDPVMVATSGSRLIRPEAVDTMCRVLIPMASVITPNIPEAEILLGGSIGSQSEMPDAARRLGRKFGVSVLLKAGHLTEENLIDYLYCITTDQIVPYAGQRLSTPNTHGTGCTLSSALAAYLAKGQPLHEAARSAKDYIAAAIIAGAGYEIGHGHGPVHHFHRFWT